jgi:MFS family permease
MKTTTLSPSELERGRRSFFAVLVLNTISFPLISGNIITLFALRLGAANTLVGLLASFIYVSYVFLLVGRVLIRRYGAVRLWGIFYRLRCLAMIPILFTPVLASQGMYTGAFALVIVSVGSFNMFRGVALTSDNPIVSELAGQKDRGVFLSQVQLVAQIVAMAVGLTMGFLLGDDAPLVMYVAFIGAGILTGLVGSFFIFRIPEPKAARQGFSQKLMDTLRQQLGKSNMRRYFAALFLVMLTLSMLAPFVIVYFKRVYLFTDGRVIFLTVIGNLGALAVALISGLTLDRLGAKPLYFVFTALVAVTIVPIIVAPSLSTDLGKWLFPGLVFFFQFMGTVGLSIAGRNYFFSISESRDSLNLGIAYFVIAGAAGAIGSLLGGAILDGLSHVFFPVDAFRVYFGLLVAIAVTILILIYGLTDTGEYGIRTAFTFIFSPRDLRALTLLRKLTKSTSADQEQKVIEELKGAPSSLSVDDLIRRLKSPSYFVRAQALSAFKAVPLDEPARKAVMAEVKNHPYTTAYMAAEILGERRVHQALKPLRQVLSSRDYFLAGKAMVALARIGDVESRARIHGIVEKTKNPRLIIYGSKALEILTATDSVSMLVRKLETRTSPFVRDEIILAIAGILRFGDWFFPHYSRFVEKSLNAVAVLEDFVHEHHGRLTEEQHRRMLQLFGSLTRGQEDSRAASVELLSQLQDEPEGEVQAIRDGLENPAILKLERFRFLVASYLVHRFLGTAPTDVTRIR